ncbi:hypothetical protein GYA49_06390 [Candidatus Beckwithbacteria bacterium]|nr:hypothetical protein [Candidatus Beckwithbacteria bacterium]
MIKKLLFILATIIGTMYVNCSLIFASNSFNEEFESDFTYPTKWEILRNSSAEIVSFDLTPGFITLSSSSSHFPVVTTSENVFPQNNFEVELAFQYINGGSPFGDGIIFSENKPNYPAAPNASVNLFGVWQGGTPGLIFATEICPIEEPGCSSSKVYSINSSSDNSYHVLKISYHNSQYKIYIDNDLLLTTIETTRRPSFLWLGNPYQLSSPGAWNNFKVDYIHIKPLPDKALDVPFFSQIDDDWKDNEYDHYSSIDPTHNSIGDWGCAMTSSAMILKYYGFDTDPFGTQTSPESLNEYLATQSGYNKYGALVWSAITKYAKQAKENGLTNPSTRLLEFSYPSYSYQNIKDYIDNSIPSIVKVVTNDKDTQTQSDDNLHFVVARGYADNENLGEDGEVYIHDPLDEEASDSATLSSNYNGKEYRQIGKFTQSDTDLSYLWLYTYSPTVNVLAEFDGLYTGIDENGTEFDQIPNAKLFTEGQVNSFDYTLEISDYRVFMLPKPSKGEYKFHFSGTPNSEIDFELFAYNEIAQDQVFPIIDLINPDGNTTYIFNYSPIAGEGIGNLEEVNEANPVTFNSIRQYISEQEELGNIKTVTAKVLIKELDLAEWFYNRDMSKITQILLRNSIRWVDKLNKKQINQDTKKELVQMLEELKNNLNQ